MATATLDAYRRLRAIIVEEVQRPLAGHPGLHPDAAERRADEILSRARVAIYNAVSWAFFAGKRVGGDGGEGGGPSRPATRRFGRR